MSGRKHDTVEGEEEVVHELDGILPGGIDRRKFLYGSLSSFGAMMLAGCTGSGSGGGGSGSGSGGQSSDQAIFTTPWKKEPTWGTAYVAEGKGYWEEQGVANAVNGVPGNGSDTEALNIGTGNREMGISSLPTALSVYPETEQTEALNMKMVGMSKGRGLLSLIWPKNKLKHRGDIAGKTLYAASGFAAATTNLYPNMVGVDPSKVTFQEGTETAAAAKLATGEVDAIWGAIGLLPVIQSEVDAELEVTPLTDFGPFYGFPIWVNTPWYENRENNVEIMSNVLTGYYKALKWVLLNQDAYLEYLVNEVNPKLKTWTEEELTSIHSVLCATVVIPEMKEKGLGYFTEEGVEFVLEKGAPALLENPDTLPSASKLTDRRAWKQSEKVTFTDSEWNQLAKTAGVFWDVYTDSGSGN